MLTMTPTNNSGLERQLGNTRKEIPSCKLETLLCSWCSFLGLPRTVRLHQLFSCFATDSDVISSKDSVQQYQKSPKRSLIWKLLPCSVKLKRLQIAVGSGGSSDVSCDLCGFFASPMNLRLHQLLGCCSVKLNDKQIRILDRKSVKFFVSKMTTNSIRFEENRLVKNITNDQLSELKEHNLVNVKKNCFSCEICSYKCGYKSHLKRHNLSHTEEKAFSCKVCNYKCKYLFHLKQHNLIHTGEKPYKCEICDFTCRILGGLKSHNLKHTKEMPFSCDLCSYVCNRTSRLKLHKLTHTTGEKLFSCDVCSWKFNYRGNLTRHTLTHTKVLAFS